MYFLLKKSTVIPAGEAWLHTTEMKQKLAQADQWMQSNPAKDTDVDAMETKADGVAA